MRGEVRAAMEPYFSGCFGDPGSLHHLGIEAREALATARARHAGLVNAERPDRIVFTSSGVEAANLAIKGTAFARQEKGRHLIVTEAEHPGIMESTAFLVKLGFTRTCLPVNGEGFLDPAALEAAITPGTILIATHLANHDLGCIQPVAEAARVAEARGIPLLVDAEAAAGWMPVDVQALGADLLWFSSHRFYGPRGVGALYCRRGLRPVSLIHGGGQEEGRRAGAENVAAIVGAGVAADLAVRELPARMTHTRELQELLWRGLSKAVSHLKLNGPPPGPGRVTTQLNFSAEFTEGEGLLLMLDMQGIQVASGSACLGRTLRMPPALKAIGLPPELAIANLIVSLGSSNTAGEIARFIDAYAQTVARLRALSPAWEEFQRGRIHSILPAYA